MKNAFDFWLETDEGKGCNNPKDLTAPRFLQNRLWRAYHAGLKQTGFNQENEILRRERVELIGELAEAKRLIKKLTKVTPK